MAILKVTMMMMMMMIIIIIISSLTAAGGAILQWTEDIPSYSWDSDDD